MNRSVEFFETHHYKPLALPHYKTAGQSLLTLNDRPIPVSGEELALFIRCDGNISVRDMNAPEILEQLYDKRLITFVPAESKRDSHRDGSRRVLVVSPHIDDAALSVGGMISQGQRYNLSFRVLNVFSVQEFQTGIRVPPECLQEIACREDEIAGRCLGYQNRHAGLKGAAERYQLNTNQFIGLVMPDIIDSPVFRNDIISVQQVIRTEIAQENYDYILAPLAIGGHLDHLVVAAAVNMLITQGELNMDNVGFYEDLPYSTAFPWRIDPASQPLCYRLTIKQLVDVGDGLEPKKAAMRAYCTRIREPQIEATIQYSRTYRDNYGLNYSEAIWSWTPSPIFQEESRCMKL